MAYSTITPKKCKCKPDCPQWPTTSFGGYFYLHAPDEIKSAQGEKARRCYQNKAKRQRESVLSRNLHKAANDAQKQESATNEAEITPQRQWFLERRKEMSGFCVCGCGKWSSKRDDKYFHCSIAHILPKAKVKSVAQHPLNWIELNFWDGCHSNFDNKSSDDWENMACWDEIVWKFKQMYPLIPDYEKRWIPQVLLNTL